MAFNATSSTQIGTKGSDVYTASGVQDPRVALSVLLTRGADVSTIRSGVDAVLAMEDKQQAIKNPNAPWNVVAPIVVDLEDLANKTLAKLDPVARLAVEQYFNGKATHFRTGYFNR